MPLCMPLRAQELSEVHPQPEKAWSDGEQSLSFAEFDEMMAMLEPYVRLRSAAIGTLLETAG